MAKKKASSTLYFIFFFIIFLAFCAFAVDGAIVLTNRAKLQNITESAALAAAEQFNSASDPTTNVANTATTTFSLLQQDNLKMAIIDPPVVDTGSRIVTITTHMVSQPFFLTFLGVTGINLYARAKATSEPLTVRATGYSGINWLTKYRPYMTDIIDKDSAILKSLSTNANMSYSGTNIKWDNISSGAAGQPLSLGPGGFITIKLPVPIINKPGADLSIDETGKAYEGYMVFAGLDANPDNPYSDYTTPNGDLRWVNISCAGVAKPPLVGYTVRSSVSTNIGAQDVFYGNGNFDLSNSCLGNNVNMVKYIRIVDDNSESAYIQDPSDNQYYQTMLYGESSTTTPGADINSVQVLNYVHLQ